MPFDFDEHPRTLSKPDKSLGQKDKLKGGRNAGVRIELSIAPGWWSGGIIQGLDASCEKVKADFKCRNRWDEYAVSNNYAMQVRPKADEFVPNRSSL
ncbi:MAG TPA: hypothetical protein VKV95_06740 [Terriglobia bacterium]|nr:hypothetical protein [Terriglobia bacterium]